MKVCYFGDYDPLYARNKVLIKGLQANEVEILECRTKKRGWKKYRELYCKHREIKGQYDLLIIGQSTQSRLVWFSQLISDKPVVWDAFYSFYDKFVFDSRLISPWSIRGRYYWLVEWFACRLADKILIDTNEHINYFVQEFGVKKEKFLRVLIGSEISESEIASKEEKKTDFLVDFHGKYIPLQGTKYIIKAAKLLEKYEDIKFNMIGSGQTIHADKKLAEDLKVKNINFIKFLEFEPLLQEIKKADVCLGIFGDTQKTQRVIPNKVYEGMALRIPIISADTPAIREIFKDGQDILLCQTANPEDLAEKILKLRNNENLRKMIAENAFKLFKKIATPFAIAKGLLFELKEDLKI